MYSVEQIQQMNRESAQAATDAGVLPFNVWPQTFEADVRSIPNVGTEDVEGFEPVETFFVDSSGFGSPGEPALTFEEFVKQGLALIEKSDVSLYWAITSAGQFQVYITAFTKQGLPAKSVEV